MYCKYHSTVIHILLLYVHTMFGFDFHPEILFRILIEIKHGVKLRKKNVRTVGYCHFSNLPKSAIHIIFILEIDLNLQRL